MSAKWDITSLLGSRICHDLISPLGAIGNGLELLTMTGTGTSPEIVLIAESVENANARIRFLRVAFGVASVNQALGSSEIRSILDDLYRKSRTSVTWQIDSDSMRGEVKLIFLILLCLETAMPWGGRVTVQNTEGRWTVTGEADKMTIGPELWSLLSSPDDSVEVSSSHVHFPLTFDAADRNGRRIDVQTEPGLITVIC